MALANVAQGNSFFINVRNIVTVVGTATNLALSGPVALNADGTAATVPTWTITGNGSAGTANGTFVAAGAAVLRDLGKTINIPGNLASGTLQQKLRLVQLVDQRAMTTPLVAGMPTSFVGYNEGAGPANNVFYIAIEPNATNGVFFASLGF